MKRRQFYTAFATGLTMVIAGCSESSTNGDESASAGGGTDSHSDTDTTESTEDREFSEETETNELLLNSFDLPKEYTFYDETETTLSDLSEDDAEFTFFEDNGIARQHTREFIDDSESSAVSFITSTITIHESASDADSYRQQQVDSFSSNSDMDTEQDSTFSISTVVGRTENESGETVVYLGLADNAVYQLLFTNVDSDLETGSIFTKMVEES
jgi:hypothetical protein